MLRLTFKNFGTTFKFDLYGIEQARANFDAWVIIWTIIDLNSPTLYKIFRAILGMYSLQLKQKNEQLLDQLFHYTVANWL